MIFIKSGKNSTNEFQYEERGVVIYEKNLRDKSSVSGKIENNIGMEISKRKRIRINFRSLEKNIRECNINSVWFLFH